VEWHGFPRLSEHAADLTIELHRITERAFVEPREERELEDLWEMGIDGAYVITANKKERGVLPGAVSYTQAIRTADSFLRKAAQLGRMSERRPWRDRDAWLEMFRTIHYQEIPGKGLSLLYRGVPPVPLQMVNIETTRQSIVKAGEWYLANLQPDGQVIYKFWPAENRYSNEYNHVRHTLATWNLVQAWHMEPRPEFLEGARRALDWTLKYRVDEGEMSYFSYNDNQKLGSVVVGLLGMVDLAKATDDHQWDELMKRMGKFVLFMQEESGTFRGYHVEKGHPYFGEKNDIVPGEAALSLIYLADYFDDDSWIETLPQYWSYYRPWFEERVSRQRDGAPWPAFTYTNDDRLELVQFGPWTVMAANAYYRRKPDLEVADFALEIARWMIDSYQWTEERTPFPDYVGGYYKLPGELPAMQAFCYAEGTAAAYQLALKARPEQAPFFEKSTREAVRFGIQMQFDEHSTYPFSRPEQVDGGIRYAMNETKVRIDYVHHALSAMYLYYQGALEDPNLPASVAVRSAPGDAPGTDAEGSAEEPSDLASVPESAAAE
jgi:hypothetical protein